MFPLHFSRSSAFVRLFNPVSYCFTVMYLQYLTYKNRFVTIVKKSCGDLIVFKNGRRKTASIACRKIEPSNPYTEVITTLERTWSRVFIIFYSEFHFTKVYWNKIELELNTSLEEKTKLLNFKILIPMESLIKSWGNKITESSIPHWGQKIMLFK